MGTATTATQENGIPEIGDSRTLADLQGAEYTFVQSADDARKIAEDCGTSSSDVTGAVVRADNGEYLEVWLSESSRPFDLVASYTRVGLELNVEKPKRAPRPR